MTVDKTRYDDEFDDDGVVGVEYHEEEGDAAAKGGPPSTWVVFWAGFWSFASLMAVLAALILGSWGGEILGLIRDLARG